eukprot:SAG31_NODE_4885_length_2885_cov_3.044149_2_plen_46_part_00
MEEEGACRRIVVKFMRVIQQLTNILDVVVASITYEAVVVSIKSRP